MISFETEDEATSQVVSGCNDTLMNDGYVFCNDEVTFYNPGIEMEYGEMENDNNETNETNIQIQIDSSHVHIDEHTDVSDCNAPDREVEKTIEFKSVSTSLEDSRSMSMVPQGKLIILTKIVDQNDQVIYRQEYNEICQDYYTKFYYSRCAKRTRYNYNNLLQ